MKTLIVGLAAGLLIVGSAAAQELEPRAYSPSPVGTTFVVVSATRSAGGVFTDASLPITNVEATVGVLGLSIGRTFALAGKQVFLLGIVPVTWGEASGDVGEESRTASRRGMADARVRLSTILAGSPAMSPAEFARAPRRTIVGASLTVGAPVGEYDAAKLINLGSNRWAFKPELALSYPAGRWTLDGYAGVWFFTVNDTFYPGSSRRTQDPIAALQGHVSYTLGRRSWLALNATWYSGGETSIDGVDKNDLLSNTRLGATWALPIGTRQSFKVSYSAGATTRIGADFRTISFAWQVVFY
jgi:hypothetical protein